MGGDGHRIDRATGQARELDDARAADPSNLGNVGSQRHIVAFRERREHLIERGNASFLVEIGAVRAGPADRADAQPFGRDGVDLAVAMKRNQDLGAMVRPPDERHEEMLAVPHGDDDGEIAFDPFLDARRLHCEPRRLPDQTQISGGHDADRLLDHGRFRHTARRKQSHALPLLSAPDARRRSRDRAAGAGGR